MVKITLAAAFLVVGLGAAPAGAVEEPAGWAYDLANELMSPFCPGRSLADCPSPNAGTLRAWLIVQEASGRSRDSVMEELLARYGDQILAAPRAEGFGIAAYAVPLLVFVLGGALVALVLRRLTRRGTTSDEAPVAAAFDPEVERIIDEELAR
jgi:cytochrome c-type biogenesis protein CcmH/NrfF